MALEVTRRRQLYQEPPRPLRAEGGGPGRLDLLSRQETRRSSCLRTLSAPLTACGEALPQLYMLCPSFHEGAAAIEHVGALVGALDAFDDVSQAHLCEVTGHAGV